MDGVVINTTNERCYVCGELFRKGGRAYAARFRRPDRFGNPLLGNALYPTHDGRGSLRRTFRHKDCQPS
jgi:hypothetical protein